MVPFWDKMHTTNFRTYFSGDWDVRWGYGNLTHGHMLIQDHSKGSHCSRTMRLVIAMFGAIVPVFGPIPMARLAMALTGTSCGTLGLVL